MVRKVTEDKACALSQRKSRTPEQLGSSSLCHDLASSFSLAPDSVQWLFRSALALETASVVTSLPPRTH